MNYFISFIEPEKSTGIPKVLSELDMIPVNIPLQDPTAYPVLLDGKLLGKLKIIFKNFKNGRLFKHNLQNYLVPA